jgi:hypothetical protein
LKDKKKRGLFLSITLSIVAMFALFLVYFSKRLFFKEKEKELPVQKEVLSDDTKTDDEEVGGQKDE